MSLPNGGTILSTDFNDILLECHKEYDWFSLSTPKGSITNTELFYIYQQLRIMKPIVLIESGVYLGRSTLVFSKMMKPFGKVIAFNYHVDPVDAEKSHIKDIEKNNPNLTVINEKTEVGIDKINWEERSFLVIDGPKPAGFLRGRNGWEVLAKSLSLRSFLCFFQHDISFELNRTILLDYHKRFFQEYNYSEISEEYLKSNVFHGRTDKPNLAMLKKSCKF